MVERKEVSEKKKKKKREGFRQFDFYFLKARKFLNRQESLDTNQKQTETRTERERKDINERT